MKKLILIITILSTIIVTSCSKKDTVPVNNSHQGYIYTLTFQIENDHAAIYKIQSSIDNINFTTIDSISYNLANNGIYNHDLKLKEGTYIRVIANDSSTNITSEAVLANP